MADRSSWTKPRHIGWKQPRAAECHQKESGNQPKRRNRQPQNAQQPNVPGDAALPRHERRRPQGFAASGTKRGRSAELSPATIAEHVETSLPVLTRIYGSRAVNCSVVLKTEIDHPTATTTRHPTTLYQRNALGKLRGCEDGGLAGEDSHERSGSRAALHEERQHEHAQHPAIEQRSDLVDGLDQRSESRGGAGEDHGVDTPEHRRHAGCPEIVSIGAVLSRCGACKCRSRSRWRAN